jgi:hypothetical protein
MAEVLPAEPAVSAGAEPPEEPGRKREKEMAGVEPSKKQKKEEEEKPFHVNKEEESFNETSIEEVGKILEGRPAEEKKFKEAISMLKAALSHSNIFSVTTKIGKRIQIMSAFRNMTLAIREDPSETNVDTHIRVFDETVKRFLKEEPLAHLTHQDTITLREKMPFSYETPVTIEEVFDRVRSELEIEPEVSSVSSEEPLLKAMEKMKGKEKLELADLAGVTNDLHEAVRQFLDKLKTQAGILKSRGADRLSEEDRRILDEAVADLTANMEHLESLASKVKKEPATGPEISDSVEAAKHFYEVASKYAHYEEGRRALYTQAGIRMKKAAKVAAEKERTERERQTEELRNELAKHKDKTAELESQIAKMAREKKGTKLEKDRRRSEIAQLRQEAEEHAEATRGLMENLASMEETARREKARSREIEEEMIRLREQAETAEQEKREEKAKAKAMAERITAIERESQEGRLEKERAAFTAEGEKRKKEEEEAERERLRKIESEKQVQLMEQMKETSEEENKELRAQLQQIKQEQELGTTGLQIKTEEAAESSKNAILNEVKEVLAEGNNALAAQIIAQTRSERSHAIAYVDDQLKKGREIGEAKLQELEKIGRERILDLRAESRRLGNALSALQENQNLQDEKMKEKFEASLGKYKEKEEDRLRQKEKETEKIQQEQRAREEEMRTQLGSLREEVARLAGLLEKKEKTEIPTSLGSGATPAQERRLEEAEGGLSELKEAFAEVVARMGYIEEAEGIRKGDINASKDAIAALELEIRSGPVYNSLSPEGKKVADDVDENKPIERSTLASLGTNDLAKLGEMAKHKGNMVSPEEKEKGQNLKDAIFEVKIEKNEQKIERALEGIKRDPFMATVRGFPGEGGVLGQKKKKKKKKKLLVEPKSTVKYASGPFDSNAIAARAFANVQHMFGKKK